MFSRYVLGPPIRQNMIENSRETSANLFPFFYICSPKITKNH